MAKQSIDHVILRRLLFGLGLGFDYAKAHQACDHPKGLGSMSKDDRYLLFAHMMKNKSGRICRKTQEC